MADVFVYEVDGTLHTFTTSQNEYFIDPDTGAVVYQVLAPSVETFTVAGLQGPAGPKGDKGDKGDQGVPGGGFNYVHDQAVAEAIWTVVHNLGGYPNVAVVDSAGTMVEGNVEYVDISTVRLSFVGAFSGRAFLS